MIVGQFLKSFINILFPKVCIACSDALAGNEKHVCTSCITKLPQTGFWNIPDNQIAKIFWGRVRIETAASFLFFEKDSTLQHLLHHLKYKNRPEVGMLLGSLFGTKLHHTAFNKADFIIPVPLHKKREIKRGYNQSVMIARGIGDQLNIPVKEHAVIRNTATRSQTSKSRFDRWVNVENVFSVIEPEMLTNKHLIVVDDVITTGATTESLIHELLKIPGAKVSVAVIASA